MKKKHSDSMCPVKLTTVNTQFEGDILLGLLDENNIPAFRQHAGSGSYMMITMGYSVFGSDIYVNEADYERAAELLEYLETEADAEDFSDTAEDFSEEESFDSDDGSESGDLLSRKEDPRYRVSIFFVRIMLVFILGSLGISAVGVIYLLITSLS